MRAQPATQPRAKISSGWWPSTLHHPSQRTSLRREPGIRTTASMWGTARWCTTGGCPAAGGPDRWRRCPLPSLRADALCASALTATLDSSGMSWSRGRDPGSARPAIASCPITASTSANGACTAGTAVTRSRSCSRDRAGRFLRRCASSRRVELLTAATNKGSPLAPLVLDGARSATPFDQLCTFTCAYMPSTRCGRTLQITRRRCNAASAPRALVGCIHGAG